MVELYPRFRATGDVQRITLSLGHHLTTINQKKPYLGIMARGKPSLPQESSGSVGQLHEVIGGQAVTRLTCSMEPTESVRNNLRTPFPSAGVDFLEQPAQRRNGIGISRVIRHALFFIIISPLLDALLFLINHRLLGIRWVEETSLFFLLKVKGIANTIRITNPRSKGDSFAPLPLTSTR